VSAVEVVKEDKAVEWLLDSKSPAVRYWTLRDLLGQPEMEYEVVQAREQIASWTPVAEYLNEQHFRRVLGLRRGCLLAKMDRDSLAAHTPWRDRGAGLEPINQKGLRVFLESHGRTGSHMASTKIS
jgi:hypothetical protein